MEIIQKANTSNPPYFWGAVGTAGIIGGGIVGYRLGGLGHGLAVVQTVGFLALHIGERIVGKNLRKEINTQGVNVLGQFFNDRFRVINSAQQLLLAGAVLNYRWMIGNSAETSPLGYSHPLLNRAFDLTALIFLANGVARIFRLKLESNQFTHKQNIEDKSIRLFMEEGDLKLEIEDLTNNTVQEQTMIPAGTKGMRDRIVQLSKCKPVLDDSGALVFSPPLLTKVLVDRWLEIKSEKVGSMKLFWNRLDRYFGRMFSGSMGALIEETQDCSISCGSGSNSSHTKYDLDPKFEYRGQIHLLMNKQEKLIWQIYLEEMGKTMQIPFSNMVFEEFDIWGSHQDESRLKRERFEWFRKRFETGRESQKACLEFLKDFHIVDAKDKGKGEKSEFFIALKPILREAISSIDPAFMITKSQWGVTIVCSNGCIGNHAEIVIEGIDEKTGYFMQLAHLFEETEENDKGKITKSKISTDYLANPGKLKYTGRTRYWAASPAKVKRMLREIEEEKANPPKLNPFADGKYGVKNGEESCFTWAKKKMAILGIYLEDGIFNKLVSVTCLYTTINDCPNS